jgi:hypothetical protein
MGEVGHQFDVQQRVRIKHDATSSAPPDKIHGKSGTIEDYSEMFAERQDSEPHYVPQWFVVIDDSDEPAYLVAEDWLETA